MGASTLVTRPTLEVISLAEAKLHLRIDSTDHDAALAGYIVAARRFAQAYTRRVLMTQTWATTFDEWPTVGCDYRIDFPVAPVQSVSSITYTDENGATQTLAADQYTVHGTGAEGLPYIVPAYDVTWPTLRGVPDAVRVQYVAGYGSQPGDVPEELRIAIMLHTEMLFDRNPQARNLLEESRNALLDPYRVARI